MIHKLTTAVTNQVRINKIGTTTTNKITMACIRRRPTTVEMAVDQFHAHQQTMVNIKKVIFRPLPTITPSNNYNNSKCSSNKCSNSFNSDKNNFRHRRTINTNTTISPQVLSIHQHHPHLFLLPIKPILVIHIIHPQIHFLPHLRHIAVEVVAAASAAVVAWVQVVIIIVLALIIRRHHLESRRQLIQVIILFVFLKVFRLAWRGVKIVPVV